MNNLNTPYEIYVITTADYWYVGSASGKKPFASRRFNEHMRGYKSATKLQDVLSLLGPDVFSFEVLEQGVGDVVKVEREWYHLGQVVETRECLNGGPPHLGGSLPGHMVGHETSSETRDKLSASLRGRKLGPRSPEHSAKLSAVRKGKPPSNKGKPSPLRGVSQTPEWIAKRTGANIGSKRTPEQCANISASLKGKPSPSKGMKKTIRIRDRCADCDMVAVPGAMVGHVRASGHTLLPRE